MHAELEIFNFFSDSSRETKSIAVQMSVAIFLKIPELSLGRHFKKAVLNKRPSGPRLL